MDCPPLKGNPDFYGLGIRIGIYLQWISAWASLLLDSESAQGILDASSTTVFAVVIATIIAARRDAPAIEIYIMLQILLGFPITTLSSFGIRLWLMNPSRFSKLMNILSDFWQQQKDKRRQRREEAQREEEERDRARLQRRAGRQERRARQQQTSSVWKLVDWTDDLVREFAVIMQITGAGIPVLAPGAGAGGTAGILYMLWHLPVQLPLQFLSSLKFPGLSWSGVVWRTVTVALVAGYNAAYWWDTDGHGVQQPREDTGCGPPTVFVFARPLLQYAVVSLGQVAAIIIGIMVIPPTIALFLLTVRMTCYGVIFLCRDLIYAFTPSTRQTLRQTLDRVNHLLHNKKIPIEQALQFYSAVFPGGIVAVQTAMVSSAFDLFEFMATPEAEAIRFSDVIKVAVSLGMGKPSMREPQTGPNLALKGRAATMLSGWKSPGPGNPRFLRLSRICIVWNVYTILSIVWFILSIELTIRWNNIEDVNTIDSTGQLIPFIIGCVSASQAFKKLMLLGLAKKYPDYVDVRLEVESGIHGPAVIRIVKQGVNNDTAGADADSDSVAPRQGDMPLVNVSSAVPARSSP